MTSNIDDPSGWYFQEHRDPNFSHQCSYYYKKVVHKAATSPHSQLHHPIMIVLTAQHFRIYWRGHVMTPMKDRDEYGVHLIFSTEFGAMHQDHFLDWINHAKLLPKAHLDQESSLYAVKNISFDHAFTYGNTYHADLNHFLIYESLSSIAKKYLNKIKASLHSLLNRKQIEVNQQIEDLDFEDFFLDLLFDLNHSNVFRQHPSYLKLLAFLESIPKVKAIWLKAEFQLTHFLHRDASIREGQFKDSKKREHNRRLALAQEEYTISSEKWLAFIRSSESERILKPNKDDKWFSGAEGEHNAVFKASNADSLNKQAEESVQWLIGRYAMWRAYILQFGRLYNNYSKIAILIPVVLFGVLYCSDCQWFSWLPRPEAFKVYHPLFQCFIAITAIGVCFILGMFIERLLYLGYSVSHIWLICSKMKPPSRTWGEILFSTPKIVETLKPKIFLASAAIWAVLFSTDAPWNLEFCFDRYYWGMLIILWFVTGLFLASHLAHLVFKKHKFFRVFLRSFTLYLISIFYAFIIGFVGMAYSSRAHITKGEEFSEYLSQFDKRIGNFLPNQKGLYVYCSQSDENQDICDALEGKNLDKTKKIKRDWLYENTLMHLYRDTITPNKKVCYVFSLEMDKKLMPSRKYVIVVDTLLFFTFVAAALGLMLEMGLQPKKSS